MKEGMQNDGKYKSEKIYHAAEQIAENRGNI